MKPITDIQPRCKHPHPQFMGMTCNNLLILKATRPWEAVCRKCKRVTTMVDQYAQAVPAKMIEK